MATMPDSAFHKAAAEGILDAAEKMAAQTHDYRDVAEALAMAELHERLARIPDEPAATAEDLRGSEVDDEALHSRRRDVAKILKDAGCQP